LFRQLKGDLRGKRFDDDEELKVAVDQCFRRQDEIFYRSGIESLKSKWEKCIRLLGDYIEKE
jgi:hypothetical protein